MTLIQESTPLHLFSEDSANSCSIQSVSPTFIESLKKYNEQTQNAELPPITERDVTPTSAATSRVEAAASQFVESSGAALTEEADAHYLATQQVENITTKTLNELYEEIFATLSELAILRRDLFDKNLQLTSLFQKETSEKLKGCYNMTSTLVGSFGSAALPLAGALLAAYSPGSTNIAQALQPFSQHIPTIFQTRETGIRQPFERKQGSAQKRKETLNQADSGVNELQRKISELSSRLWDLLHEAKKIS